MSRSPKDVPVSKVLELSRGQEASANLAEWLTVDFRTLVPIAFVDLGLSDCTHLALQEIEASKKQTVPALTALVGMFLAQQPAAHTADFLSHPSDTVRCWGAYVKTGKPERDWLDVLHALQPYADDPHFGVREVAWMALRPRIVSQPTIAIQELKPWTLDERDHLRRFAVEATRPRGVWCTHINELKDNPELAIELLEPLYKDESLYVRKSVGNWLNDAGKTRPDFVLQLINAWELKSDSNATRHIIKLASRNL